MIKYMIKAHVLTAALLASWGSTASASAFSLPAPGDALVGTPDKIIYTKAEKDETLLEVARRYDLGQNQIVKANKDVDRWYPSKPVETLTRDKEGNQYMRMGEGRDIRIPNSYLLPNVPRQGIVLNLPEYRFYYYRGGDILTHPISIGRVDWNTPLGLTSIVAKVQNPTWTPPESIRREHAEQGDILPAVYPAGPDNPLGLYALRLGRAGYLIHSTNKPLGVGMRVSHGCIRMYPEDIEKMFPGIAVGTQVHIINQPIKAGWHNGSLYIEVHPDLEDAQRSFQERMDVALSLIEQAKGNELISISGSALRQALIDSNGIPVAIYKSSLVPDSAPTIVKMPTDTVSNTVTPTSTETTNYSILQAPPSLNSANENALPNTQPALSNESTYPPAVEAMPGPPRLQEPANYSNDNTTLQSPAQPATNNLPPVPQLRDNVNTPSYSILPNTPPSQQGTLPPVPQLNENEDYSILKNAVPMN